MDKFNYNDICRRIHDLQHKIEAAEELEPERAGTINSKLDDIINELVVDKDLVEEIIERGTMPDLEKIKIDDLGIDKEAASYIPANMIDTLYDLVVFHLRQKQDPETHKTWCIALGMRYEDVEKINKKLGELKIDDIILLRRT